MMRNQPLPPLGRLTYVMYVIRMGWPRWKPAARERWTRELLNACEETAHECRIILRNKGAG